MAETFEQQQAMIEASIENLKRALEEAQAEYKRKEEHYIKELTYCRSLLLKVL